MPFVRISLPQALTEAEVGDVSDAVHNALVHAFDVPAKDRFQVITRHAPQELVWAPEFLGVAHGKRIAFVQITCTEGRSVSTKKALYARLAASIAASGAVAAADVIVNLVEVKREDWSLGNGQAQFLS